MNDIIAKILIQICLYQIVHNEKNDCDTDCIKWRFEI